MRGKMLSWPDNLKEKVLGVAESALDEGLENGRLVVVLNPDLLGAFLEPCHGHLTPERIRGA